MKLGSMGIPGTPALVMIDRNGVVTDTWIGKLTQEKEEVLTRLQVNKTALK